MVLDDEFFARIGHDLRGELATMLAGIHYLLRYEKRLEAGPRDTLERVRGAGERLKRLLDEIDHAVWLRPDPSRPMSVAPCDAVALVHRVAGRLGEAASARGVRLLIEGGEDLGATSRDLEGDEELLAIALDYVLGFAITRSRDQPVRARVSARGGGPVVTVIDEAGAAPPDVVERLVEPFGERAAIAPDPVAPRRRERLGLGLAIARGILEAHGGGLEVGVAEVGVAAEGAGSGLRLTCALGRSARVDPGGTA